MKKKRGDKTEGEKKSLLRRIFDIFLWK
jgi:hypothetical protein